MSTAAEMRESRLVSDIEEALRRVDELVVHYMPTVSLSTGAYTGVEALARWQHPELGSISPSYFVPMVERNGFASELGDYIRSVVVNDAMAGRLPTPGVAVNVSGIELSDAGFPDRLLDLLDIRGMSPELFTVEVTETAVAADADRAIDALLRLRAAGVGVSIDDFGTGHSSLSYLAYLPCDVVKIDRSFVAGLGTNKRCTAIVHGVLSMAHALGLKVVAEGIETVGQRDDLSLLDCEEGQGYLFGVARSVEDFQPRIEPGNPRPGKPRPMVDEHLQEPARGQLLVDLSRDIAHCVTMQEGLDCMLQALRPHLVFTGGSLQMLGDDGIRMAAAHPPPTREAQAARLPAGHGVGGSIIASSHLRYIPDITVLNPGAPKQRGRAATTRDTRSYLGVPLHIAGRAVGLVQIDSVDVDAFGPEAQLLVAGCAAILAGVVGSLTE